MMTLNLLVLGNTKTGKTEFIRGLNSSHQFDFQCYDSPIDDQFGRRAPKCDAYVVCYDVTQQESFKHVNSWVQGIRKRNLDAVNILLVGTHADLDSEHRVDFEKARQFAEDNNLLFAETSIHIPVTIVRASSLLWQSLQPYDPATNTILTKLTNYLHRITTKDGGIKKDFLLFSSKQEKHRLSDCQLARTLKTQLELNPPNTGIFFEKHKAYSPELQSIITEA